MIRNGFMGDVLKLMPIMENVDPEEIDLSPVPDYLNHNTDNVSVPRLPTSLSSKYIKSTECDCDADCCPECGDCGCDCDVDQKVTGSAMGSAGNSLVDTDAEPQFGDVNNGMPDGDDSSDEGAEPMMDSLGIGAGMKPELKLQESTSGAVIDDSSIKTAKKNSKVSSTDLVKDLFDQFAFKPKASPKFDIDTTKVKISVSKEPLRKIPKGW